MLYRGRPLCPSASRMAQCLVFANASTLVANLQSLHLQRIFANHVKYTHTYKVVMSLKKKSEDAAPLFFYSSLSPVFKMIVVTPMLNTVPLSKARLSRESIRSPLTNVP